MASFRRILSRLFCSLVYLVPDSLMRRCGPGDRCFRVAMLVAGSRVEVARAGAEEELP